ncbi:TonB family protein [bacterium]|nr:TonB family protein [bacterium]
MSEFDDYKRILGLKDDFTENDLKKAYFKLAKKFHPDKNKSADATEKFKEINNAYSYLKDYIAGNSAEEESYQEETYNYQEEYSSSQEYNEPNNDSFDDFAYRYYDYQKKNSTPVGKIVFIIIFLIIIFMLASVPSRNNDNNYNKQADTTQSQVSDYDTNFDEPEQPIKEPEDVPEYTQTTDNRDNSSTEGTDFGPYMQELESRIKMNWDTPKYSESTHVVLLFKIAKDGRLMNVDIKQSSGYSDVDQAAINAVKLTAPFRPLPANYKADHIDIQFNFDYNVFPINRKNN